MKTVCVLLLLCCQLTIYAAEIVYYPRPEAEHDRRTEYPIKLLELAIRHTRYPIALQASSIVVHQKRAIREVELRTGLVSIVWTMTSIEREQQLRPIRIPIYKGLIGWRLCLVNATERDKLQHIKTVADLKTLVALQGSDWPDSDILRANGLSVEGTADYEGLFKMLRRGRADYFPRALSEIGNEAAVAKNHALAIDNHIVLHYPAAVYFFVAKDNLILANALTEGLEAAMADGSFDNLFLQYFDAVIKQANLSKRTIIELHNPLLPKETPLTRQALWFQP